MCAYYCYEMNALSLEKRVTMVLSELEVIDFLAKLCHKIGGKFQFGMRIVMYMREIKKFIFLQDFA